MIACLTQEKKRVQLKYLLPIKQINIPVGPKTRVRLLRTFENNFIRSHSQLFHLFPGGHSVCRQ